ncbi:hypothetical protein Agub_g9738 [Astrephomene gubernaculifera]|uniref:Protein kinase domain-containing protein n=1 Tax=Astrephomene gubernaculifera TaxID=47775 RepID=A0AAD3DTR9_9CHLO|nr:hypothetical protein Agub_g9738 [Astrephomene gubernaculifera]
MAAAAAGTPWSPAAITHAKRIGAVSTSTAGGHRALACVSSPPGRSQQQDVPPSPPCPAHSAQRVVRRLPSAGVPYGSAAWGGGRELRCSTGGAGSGGVQPASPHSMAIPSPSSSQVQLAATASNPSGPAYAHTPSEAFTLTLPSGSVYTASRTAGHNGAPSAGSGAAGAAHRSGAANASSDPGACTASLTPAAPIGHTFLERSSTGIYNSSMAGASHCSPMPPPAIFCHSSAGWDGYGIYGTPYSSYEQVHMSVMSGPGSALARNPTSTFIRRSELQFIQEIGCGAEGRVWRARWQHIDVAVKEMFPKASTLAKLTGAFRDVNQGRQCNEGGSPDSGPGPVPRTATGVSCSGPIPVQRSLQFGPSRPPPGPTNPTLCGGIAPAAGSDLLRTRSQTHVPPSTGAAVASSPSGVTPPATILGPCTSTTPTRPRNTANQVFWTPAAKGPTSGGPGEAVVLPEFTSLRSTAPLGSYLGSGAADVAAVIKEARAMAQLSQHPNIVRFIGICLEQPLIVTEYYPRGSVFDLLRKAADGDREACLTLHWNNRLCMLHDLAAGMSYLHSQGYLHGDLRSPNVFVAQQDRVKIGDFGYAKLLGDSGRGSASTSNSANPRWMAPEALKVGRVTLSADVFSFGVVMWELLTWQIPYDELNPFQVIVSLVHDPNFRPALPPREQLPHLPPYADLDGYLALMQQCWHCDPAARPKFDQVADRLDALKAASLGVMQRWRRSSEAGPGPRASALFRSASTASHVPAGNVPLVTDGTVAGVFPAAAAAAGGRGSSGGGAPMGQGPTPAGCPAAAHRRAASGSVVPQHPSTLPTQRSVAERPTSGGGAQGGRSGARGPSLLGPGGSSGGNANTTGLRPGSGQALAVTPSGDATLQSLPYPRLGGGGGGSDGGARPPRCNDAVAASSPAAQAAPAPFNALMVPKPLKHGNSGALSYAVAHVQPVAPPPRARQRLWGPMDSGGGLRPSMPQAQQGEGSSTEVDTAAGRPPAQNEAVVDSTGSTAPLLGGGRTKAAGMTVSDPGSVPEPSGRHSSALAPIKCDFQQQVTSEGGALRSVQSTELPHQLQTRTSSLASNAPHAFSCASQGADTTGGMRRVTGTTFAPLGHVESMNTTGSGSEGLASPFADLTLLSWLQ